MKAVASMVTTGGILADIGTDHAYVPIALVQRQKIKEPLQWILMRTACPGTGTYPGSQAGGIYTDQAFGRGRGTASK